MSNTDAAAAWADKRGFLPEVPFDDVRSTALPANGPKQSGFYLLRFDDDTFYVGESVDLRSRMGGHAAKWGSEITTVRLLPETASKQELKKYERFLTHELESKKVRLRNILLASTTAGRDALDELLSDEEQARWILNPGEYNRGDQTPLKAIPEQEVRYSTAARRYSEAPHSAMVTEVLRTYLESCVPVPRATEFQYWGVSAGTFAGTHLPRRFCVNVGKMETFVVHEDKRVPGELFGFINVRESVLFPNTRARWGLRRRHPKLGIRTVQYDDAGSDMVRLQIRGLTALEQLLADPQVTAAAARLVLDVMHKHFCVYTRYHCPQVVQLAYPEYRRPATLAASETPSVHTSFERPHELFTTDEAEIAQESAAHAESDDLAHLDDDECYWIVGCGTKRSGRNQVKDFLASGEWRMDPDPRYEPKVAEMQVGERITVRTRKNVKDDVPFERRDNSVSVMDFHLRGVITDNPGDGCSVKVDWEKVDPTPRRYYLYTSQDTVWPVGRNVRPEWDDLIEFAFDDQDQDVDYFRNLPFWAPRFGDR
ncbi:GIY-YIG nuclease family protein [Rhodococcus opacus]|uniref:GIY-YIG nuclease family protein n=1 Tax=Rhodococcus opacus TaxID=37919 RepID=UPI001C488EF3|nr:GIY-YIG nuclease family protein [Rhodococcus opacus]MBV6762182.1 GIY-YIG nuclease family protein [Rhodococcus opacus]